jgi:hypothetical protein
VTSVRRPGWRASLACAALATVALTGCTTEYHGPHSDIDGVLWRQVASFEDPLFPVFTDGPPGGPSRYIEGVGGERWDGSAASVARLDVQDGAAVIYDVAVTEATLDFSVFISSGPRPDVTTDQGTGYSGPSAVFTCYEVHGDFVADLSPTIGRTVLDECPAALVEPLPDDAAFASAEVFDG